MRTEKEKMLAGKPYYASDPQLLAERERARALCKTFNAIPSADGSAQAALLDRLLAAAPGACITPPFFCDYGYNITLGQNAYFNFNCVVLDVMPVTIGANVLFGPGVHIYTALHPMNAGQRRLGLESAKPVVIGDDVWVGGASIICPGVVIGARSVIGAGSVVTRDIPGDVFAAGNPCRVVRRVEGG